MFLRGDRYGEHPVFLLTEYPCEPLLKKMVCLKPRAFDLFTQCVIRLDTVSGGLRKVGKPLFSSGHCRPCKGTPLSRLYQLKLLDARQPYSRPCELIGCA